jgi:hypothetical protein
MQVEILLRGMAGFSQTPFYQYAVLTHGAIFCKEHLGELTIALDATVGILSHTRRKLGVRP